MAGIRTGFVTGARAKITIGGAVMAYAADVTYNLTVATIPVETMGKYEVHTNEPVSYTIGGSFSVVRYTKQDGSQAAIADQNSTVGAAGTGTALNVSAPLGTAFSAGTAPGDHINPAQLLASVTFDIGILEKESDGTTQTSVYTIYNCRITSRSASLNKRGVLVDSYSFVAVLGDDSELNTPVVAPSSMNGA